MKISASSSSTLRERQHLGLQLSPPPDSRPQSPYADILKQVRVSEFEKYLNERLELREVANHHRGPRMYGPSFVFGEVLTDGSLIHVLADHATTSLPIHAVFPTARYIPRIVRRFVDRLAEGFSSVRTWERWSAE